MSTEYYWNDADKENGCTTGKKPVPITFCSLRNPTQLDWDNRKHSNSVARMYEFLILQYSLYIKLFNRTP
jgi:hypothetical protein